MTQEEKQLLLKDLCARLPYGVKVSFHGKTEILGEAHIYSNVQTFVGESGILYDVEFVKPYLRPMSSMNEEEREEYYSIDSRIQLDIDGIEDGINLPNMEESDWLNEHHFDYRGLIEKSLALEAPEGMYKTE